MSRAHALLRNLQIKQLECLPFMEDLQAPREVFDLILDDFAKHNAVETAEKAVDAQVAKDAKAGFAPGQQSHATLLLQQELNKLGQESQQAQDAAERAIDKHYRTISLKLHPDRNANGEESSRPAFEALTKAKSCLRQSEKRRLYLDQMMQVAQISPSLVKQSHQTWIERNLREAPSRPSTSSGTQHEKPLLIKGGVISDVPRKAYVSILNLKKRRIQIEMPVDSAMHYYLQSLHVVATCPDYQDKVSVADLDKTTDSAGTNAATTVDATMPVSGVWDISWFATLHINGQSVKTPHSHESRVDLTSLEQKRRKELIRSTDELAKQRAGDVQFALRKLRGQRPDHLEIERRCDLLHEVVARGRSTLNRLLDLLRADGSDESTVTGLKPLMEALELAGPAKESLEQQLEACSKKDSLKSFKHHVAGLLESGEAAAWLRTVEESDLKSLGGETNRLYQLLVEGRVAHHLELDAATLEAASNRTDLFTSKQCEVLETKRQEAEECVAKEAERAMEQAKEKCAAEAKELAELAAMKKKAAEEEKKQELLEARFEAERQAQLAAIRESEQIARGIVVEHPANSLVEIQGLKSRDGLPLNNTIGTIVHKKGERYVVHCQVDGKLRSFLPANLNNLGFSQESLNPAAAYTTKSWNCEICTYMHEGSHTDALVCEICNNPRDNKSPSSPPSFAAVSNDPQPQEHVVRSKKKNPTTDVQPKPKAKAPATSLVQPKQQAATAKPKTEPKHNDDSSTRPCFHGSNCRFIARGCKFYHSPEEIAESAKKNLGDYQLYIPDVTVNWVIGIGGNHMRDVQRQSRAHVSIDRVHMYPKKTRCVRISGNTKSIDIAARMVKDLVSRYDDRLGGRYVATETKPEPDTKIPKTNDDASPVPPAPNKAPTRVPPPPQPVPQPKATLPSVISPPKSAYLTRPSPEVRAPSVPEPKKTMATIVANKREVTPSPPPSDRLYAVLEESKNCIKGSPVAFYKWLESEDIVSLDDLAAAVSDDEYLHEILQHGDGKVGIKGFKRVAFRNAVLAAVDPNKSPSLSNTGKMSPVEPPAELICPISHFLMVNNPVIAADGHTYEHAAIDAWFRKQQGEIAAANQEISRGQDSQQARAVVERGVLSPLTHSKLPHLTLMPNHNVRNLARAFAKNGMS